MPVRKNAKFLSVTEKENLVRAFVMMKADPVPDRPYNWFDAFVLIHRYIQNVNAPAVPGGSPARNNVNFGHAGAAFGPWHRYFLLRFEQRLQSYVPGVMLPYWDWTDPSNIMVAGFMGPNGVMANNWQVRQGYFAASAPGSGGNTTAAPAWWPAGLSGWTLPADWGTYAGPLRRRTRAVSMLPSLTAIQQTLNRPGDEPPGAPSGQSPDYNTFRRNLESGTFVPGTMHNSIHGWMGPNSHMQDAGHSPFDPMFYLHHANVDRLWAMWQMDGHGNDYPPDNQVPGHHRLNDPLYPWVGGAGGYVANGTLPGMPNLPDFSGEPAVTAADVMDHRALGYSYDCMVTIGLSLDRTASMTGPTPDPMTGMGDVSKWDATTRGVSAFLQDCEAAYDSKAAYVVAGIKTFRAMSGTVELEPVFAGTPYGLVKTASGYDADSFDAAIALQSPAGGTPIAAALSDAFNTLVQPPFGGAPADEPRYLAMFTDGLGTMGPTLGSVPNGSLNRTAVFAMGFGHPGEVNYSTLDNIVAKGAVTFPASHVFHGENAGQIDKFFSQVLANALGYAPVMDPAIEMFAGEHVHLEFAATSAEDAFYITVQGMDFDSEPWSYQLMGPDETMHYVDGSLPAHDHGGAAHGHGGGDVCRCIPHVTARRSKGRLTLFVQRNNCDGAMWVGTWMLMIARRARDLDAMLMLRPGTLLYPVTAGPVRGPRYARLLTQPPARQAARSIAAPARHGLDEAIVSTNSFEDPCTVMVNVYARTALRFALATEGARAGEPLKLKVLAGKDATAMVLQTAVRVVSPQTDLRALLPRPVPPRPGEDDPENTSARALAELECADPEAFQMKDEVHELVSHRGGAWHYHVEDTTVAGAYHFGVLLRGSYRPGEPEAADHPQRPHAMDAAATHGGHGGGGHGGHDHTPTPEPGGSGQDHARTEYFERILTVSAGLMGNE